MWIAFIFGRFGSFPRHVLNSRANVCVCAWKIGHGAEFEIGALCRYDYVMYWLTFVYVLCLFWRLPIALRLLFAPDLVGVLRICRKSTKYFVACICIVIVILNVPVDKRKLWLFYNNQSSNVTNIFSLEYFILVYFYNRRLPKITQQKHIFIFNKKKWRKNSRFS